MGMIKAVSTAQRRNGRDDRPDPHQRLAIEVLRRSSGLEHSELTHKKGTAPHGTAPFTFIALPCRTGLSTTQHDQAAKAEHGQCERFGYCVQPDGKFAIRANSRTVVRIVVGAAVIAVRSEDLQPGGLCDVLTIRSDSTYCPVAACWGKLTVIHRSVTPLRATLPVWAIGVWAKLVPMSVTHGAPADSPCLTLWRHHTRCAWLPSRNTSGQDRSEKRASFPKG